MKRFDDSNFLNGERLADRVDETTELVDDKQLNMWGDVEALPISAVLISDNPRPYVPKFGEFKKRIAIKRGLAAVAYINYWETVEAGIDYSIEWARVQSWTRLYRDIAKVMNDMKQGLALVPPAAIGAHAIALIVAHDMAEKEQAAAAKEVQNDN